jgi:hypothetical protein
MRCTATAKSTGAQCRSWATPGAVVCPMHGQNGAVKRKAEERVTLAQLMTSDPRHPWQVVLDATHTLDAIMRDHRAEVLAGETVTVDQLDRLMQLTQTTHHLASTAISTKAHEHVALAFEQHLELQGRAVGIAIGAIVNGLTRSLDTDSGERLHDWALAQAHKMLVAASDGERAEVPDVEPPPFALAVVTGAGTGTRDDVRFRDHNTVPAIEAAISGTAVPCDVAGLDDDGLRDLGAAVLDELERRNIE